LTQRLRSAAGGEGRLRTTFSLAAPLPLLLRRAIGIRGAPALDGSTTFGIATMNTRKFLKLGGAVLVAPLGGAAVAQETPRVSVVRIAELEIDPAQVERYMAAVREEMETSVRVEPGVIAIYAVAEKDNPSKLWFFEMYADEAAYEAHRDSPHFRKYFETTKDMIRARRLIEAVPAQLSAKNR
jgi:quinol monooxygenase YgiN